MAAPGSTLDLLTPGETAAALKISTRTLDRLRIRGEIAFVRVGRQVRYRADDLAAYLDRRAAVASPAPKPAPGRRRSAQGAGVVVPFTRLDDSVRSRG